TAYNDGTRFISVGKRDSSPVYVLEPNKAVSFEFFYAPASYQEVRSREEALLILKSNKTVRAEFTFEYSQNLSFLNWLNWRQPEKEIMIVCQINIEDVIIKTFDERGYFSVGDGTQYAVCSVNGVDQLVASQRQAVQANKPNASNSR